MFIFVYILYLSLYLVSYISVIAQKIKKKNLSACELAYDPEMYPKKNPFPASLQKFCV